MNNTELERRIKQYGYGVTENADGTYTIIGGGNPEIVTSQQLSTLVLEETAAWIEAWGHRVGHNSDGTYTITWVSGNNKETVSPERLLAIADEIEAQENGAA